MQIWQMSLTSLLKNYYPIDLICGQETGDWADEVEMWFVKMAEVFYSPVFPDIESHVILTPIMLSDGDIVNGHHRIAAAMLLGYETVPVADWAEWDGNDRSPLVTYSDEDSGTVGLDNLKVFL